MPESRISKVRRAIDSLAEGIIVFLLGEEDEEWPSEKPLYTREELDEFYSVKKDRERTLERLRR